MSILPRRTSAARHVFLLSVAQAALLSIPAVRLFQMQITQNQKYRNLADGNRIALHPLLQKRGIIRSVDGAILADNRNNYRAEPKTIFHNLLDAYILCLPH